MHHFLSLIFSSTPLNHFPDIELESVSRDFHPISEITSKEYKSSDQITISILHMGHRLDMSFGDQEHMDTSLRMDVIDNQILRILIYQSRWDFMVDDRTKKAHKV